MRGSLPLCFCLVLACAGHAPDPLELEDPLDQELVHEPGPQLAEAQPELVPDPTVVPAPECLPDDFVPREFDVARRLEPRRGECWKVPKSMRKTVSAGIREEWSFEHEGSKLRIGTGCDRLGATADAIQEVIVHGGVGHGGSMDLTRLTRRRDGDWDVMVLGVAQNEFVSVPPMPQGEVLRGRLEGKRVRRAIDLARTAMALEPREVKPDPEPFGGSYGFSSADFHALVRVIDDRGRSREITFTGYMSSGGQETWTRALAAEMAFAELIDTDELEPTDVDANSRQFFMERFMDARANDFYGEYGWWVRERLVGMAGVHGAVDLVPTLAEHLCVGGPDASDGRTRADALESIIELVGAHETLRRDEKGWIRDEVALRWADACGTSCSAK